MQELQRQLTALRRAVWCLFALALLAFAAALIAAKPPAKPDGIVVNSVTIVDEKYTPQAMLSGSDKGAALTILDADGKKATVLVTREGVQSARYTVPNDEKTEYRVWIDKTGINAPRFTEGLPKN